MAKILLFSRECAPYCNSVGSTLRALTMANYLKNEGHTVKLLAAKGAYVSNFGLKEEIEVINPVFLFDKLQDYYTKKAISIKGGDLDLSRSKPAHISRLIKFLKKYTLPDIAIYFLPKFIIKTLKIIKQDNIEYLIVTSPPHSSQILGLTIKYILGDKIKLIVDYRDGWNTFGLFTPKGKYRLMVSKYFEKIILNNCDYFLYQSNTVLEKIKRLYPTLKDNLDQNSLLVRNGYTELVSSKRQILEIGESVAKKIYTIGYFGGLDLTSDNFRNPSEFIRILDSLEIQLVLKLYGLSVGIELIENLKNIQIENCGVLELGDAKREMKKCDALFVFHASDNEGEEVIPGKFYEYIESQRPIIVYGPSKMECGVIVSKENFGIHFPISHSSNDLVKLKNFLNQGYKLYNDHYKISKFSRNYQYNKMNDKIFK